MNRRDGDLGALGPVADEVDDGVAGVVGNPGPGQSSPSSFFSLICSSINSATTSFLRWSLSRRAAMVRWRWPLGRGVLALEGGGAVLEELLLPEVEQRGRELVLVAEVRDGDVVDQVAPKDGDLLDRRIVLAGLSHGETPAEL